MCSGLFASAFVFLLTSLPPVLAAADADLDLSKLPAAATTATDFARDIQPLLMSHCLKCHGTEKQKGGLRLDMKSAALKGGDDGKVILPGNSAGSRLVHLVAGLMEDKIMPPKGERLTAEQVGLLRAWIDQGGFLAGRREDGARAE